MESVTRTETLTVLTSVLNVTLAKHYTCLRWDISGYHSAAYHDSGFLGV